MDQKDPLYHMPHPEFYQKPSPCFLNDPLLNDMQEGFFQHPEKYFSGGDLGKFLTKIIAKYSGHNKEKQVTYVVLPPGRFFCQRSGIAVDKLSLKTALLFLYSNPGPSCQVTW